VFRTKLKTLLFVPCAALLLGSSDCLSTLDEPIYPSGVDDVLVSPPEADELEDDREISCVPAERLTCGELTTADTSDWNDGATDEIDFWELSGGDSSGPEIAHIFTANVTETVEFRLLDVDLGAVDHDVYVLDGNTDCSPDEAFAWGSDSVTFEAEAGRSYYLVVDGRDDAAGPYAAELDCEGPVDPDPEPPLGGECDGLIGLSANDEFVAVAQCRVVAQAHALADGVWATGAPTYDVLSTDLCIAHSVHDFNDEPYLVVGGTMTTEATDGSEYVSHTAFVGASGDTTASVTDMALSLTGWSAGIDVDENFQTLVSIVYDIESETMSYVLESKPWAFGDPEVQYSAVLDCEAF